MSIPPLMKTSPNAAIAPFQMSRCKGALVFGLTLVAITACRSSDSAKPNQTVGGVVYLSDKEPTRALESGPFFLTDVIVEGHGYELFTAADPACNERDDGNLFERLEPEYKPLEADSHHGMRLEVAAGKTLCFRSLLGQTKLVWSATKTSQKM